MNGGLDRRNECIRFGDDDNPRDRGSLAARALSRHLSTSQHWTCQICLDHAILSYTKTSPLSRTQNNDPYPQTLEPNSGPFFAILQSCAIETKSPSLERDLPFGPHAPQDYSTENFADTFFSCCHSPSKIRYDQVEREPGQLPNPTYRALGARPLPQAQLLG